MSKIKNVLAKWGFLDSIKLLAGIYVVKFYEKANKLYVNNFKYLIDENKKIEVIKSFGYEVSRHGNLLEFSNRNENFKILCRKHTSDVDVVKQIFIDDEFKELIELVRLKGVVVKNIIDAGSNIGLSTIRFSKEFTGSKVYSIEPFSANYNMLEKNIRINNIDATTLKSGLWNKSTKLYFDRSFRDGKEWSISLTEENVGGDFVDAISVNDLLGKYNINQIDLLKIDVEGGERFIFDEYKNSLHFLEKTKVIAIELHDEFNVSEGIIAILQRYKFEISRSGEYVIGINKS
ncbi:FkbM family methyltransferase [Hymenobacter sp. YC55]|uniref:FkbM family methyltransferase n=1 Tax=Hymenobacter sp. YC55 TaxID=3034019 RepID=UPI0023F65F3B|nr:FkbM family methyltransferase [Hymenobacter sp. YC55]MDF7810185.1 FkbM family methyltransferase [Hymenobacter sp. YC55]